MSKVSRGMKISLIFILNPHRIFLASAVWLSDFVYWLALPVREPVTAVVARSLSMLKS
ncbi:TPA: hypothetical protein LC301_001092 [Salmonella enterica subsp. enterica serovar Veneziana]|nr:hypothetical protein [Salmonella enterica subsp. enterica serovar Veneziana]